MQQTNVNTSDISAIDNQKERNAYKNYYTEKDTIFIGTGLGDTLKVDKSQFNSIIDNHPEFFEDHPSHPDRIYYNDNNSEEFNSEAGQDIYYVLYAYFLKQRNGDNAFVIQRQKLIDIYLNINALFQRLEYGGTYFGHQCSRILGYAEYSIYLMPKSKDDFNKSYAITKQKELYIKSLRQLIKDESTIDFITLGKDKEIRNKELNEIVDKLEELITDNFYLRRAQEFQHSHYEYY